MASARASSLRGMEDLVEGPKEGLATAPRADSRKPTRRPTTCLGICRMGEALGHPHPHRKELAMVAILGAMTCTSKAFSNLPPLRTTVGASAVSMQVEVETSMEETGTAAATGAVAMMVAGVTEEPIEAPTEVTVEGEIMIDRLVIEVPGTTIEEAETTTEVTEVIEAVASTTGQPTEEETAGRATTLGRVGMVRLSASQRVLMS